jgi:hypothetical protein
MKIRLQKKPDFGEKSEKRRILNFFSSRLAKAESVFIGRRENEHHSSFCMVPYMVADANNVSRYGGLGYGALLKIGVELAQEKSFALSIFRRLLRILTRFKRVDTHEQKGVDRLYLQNQ